LFSAAYEWRTSWKTVFFGSQLLSTQRFPRSSLTSSLGPQVRNWPAFRAFSVSQFVSASAMVGPPKRPRQHHWHAWGSGCRRLRGWNDAGGTGIDGFQRRHVGRRRRRYGRRRGHWVYDGWPTRGSNRRGRRPWHWSGREGSWGEIPAANGSRRSSLPTRRWWRSSQAAGAPSNPPTRSCRD
jgi:hypothetical protein